MNNRTNKIDYRGIFGQAITSRQAEVLKNVKTDARSKEIMEETSLYSEEA